MILSRGRLGGRGGSHKACSGHHRQKRLFCQESLRALAALRQQTPPTAPTSTSSSILLYYRSPPTASFSSSSSFPSSDNDDPSSSSSSFLAIRPPALASSSSEASHSHSCSITPHYTTEWLIQQQEKAKMEQAEDEAKWDAVTGKFHRSVPEHLYSENGGPPPSPDRCPALVLNADLTPITLWPFITTPWFSAVTKARQGRLSILATYDRKVRSTHALHPLPSVVALNELATPVRPQSAYIHCPPPYRRNVFLRDSYNCSYCGRRFTYRALTIDHVIPRSLGGQDTWSNLTSSCQHCNSRKGAILPWELDKINMRLMKPPTVPTAIELAHTYVELLPQNIMNQWWKFLDKPLTEAMKLRGERNDPPPLQWAC